MLARIVCLPHAEIARRMERTESSTRNLLGRAMTRLADEMETGGGGGPDPGGGPGRDGAGPAPG